MKYFVSNGYVEKIMDNLKTNNDQIKNKLEGQMEELQEMFTSYTNIREIELPRFGAKIDAMDARQNNLFRWIIKSNGVSFTKIDAQIPKYQGKAKNV